MRTCPSCGKGIADNTKFCPFCGTPCGDGEPAAQQSDLHDSSYNNSYNSSVNNSEQKSASGLSIAGLILGIVALVFAFIPSVSFIAWICGVVGIILSAVAISQSKAAGQKNGIAVAGLVLSIISIALGLVVFVIACGVAACTATTIYW